MAIGFLLAIVVGMTLGLVGSGGTILTVPILVYVMGVDPVLATTYSLFAVGTTAAIGAIRGLYRKEVDVFKIFHFGVPSLITVFLTRTYILPLVPEVFVIAGYEFQQSVVLMLLFALIMMASGYSMIRSGRVVGENVQLSGNPFVLSLITGVTVGFVTGAVGAGGGFLIIPALISIFGMSMRRAVSTSLAIIAINSLFGILGDLEKTTTFNWSLLGGYTIFTVVGIFLGFLFVKHIKPNQLKKGFGYFILIVAIYIFCKEMLIHSPFYTFN